jgi:hypothetical protein
MVKESPDQAFLEALMRKPNRSFRRYNLVLKDGVAHFEQDPICKAFDEVLGELCGLPSEDRE